VREELKVGKDCTKIDVSTPRNENIRSLLQMCISVVLQTTALDELVLMSPKQICYIRTSDHLHTTSRGRHKEVNTEINEIWN
jgi:hypothetical protein